jgi:hypothetical protein
MYTESICDFILILEQKYMYISTSLSLSTPTHAEELERNLEKVIVLSYYMVQWSPGRFFFIITRISAFKGERKAL